MPYVIALTDPRALQLDLAGGKAAGLARLLHGGFAVPDGVVVTTDAGRAMAAGVLPPGLAEELAAVLDPACAYAVRSSATAEDLAEASFAGQHDTILGCTGLPAVLDAVRRCFASLHGERAVAYRRDRGSAESDIAMAVVVQRMVAAQAAGVAFTLDPVGGALDEIHISAHPGLGECVVNGEAEVDRFVLAKSDLALRSAEGTRATLCLSPAQGCLRRRHRPRNRGRARRAAGHRMGHRRRRRAGAASPSRHRPPHTLDPRRVRRALPQPRDAAGLGFRRCGLPRGAAGLVRPHGAAADAGAMVHLVRRLCLRQPDRRRPLPGPPDRRHREPRCTSGRLAGAVAPLRLGGRIARRVAADAGSDPAGGRTVGTGRPAGRTAAEIWAHIQRINDTGRRYFRHNIAISIGQAVVHRALRGLLGHVAGTDAGASYDALMAAVETRTATLGRGLDALAELARAGPELGKMLRTTPARQVVAASGLARYPGFHQAFTAFLNNHAHRELDADPHQPTWGDAPWTALDAVTARLDSQPAARDGAARRQKAASVLQLLCAGLPDELGFLLQELVRLARLYTELDDLEHYQTARLGPLLRRAVQALGASVADHLPLADPLDLFFAREDALAQAIATGQAAMWQAVGNAVSAAKRDYVRQQASSPVWSLVDAPEPAVDEDALQGIPGSPGRATGPAYVVRSPDDFAACPPGAVLVVRATTPAWTALIARAAGIVAESGGPLSHGAIAAREYGIPAVMAVRGAMTRLTNGQTLQVDGGRGTIQCR